MKSVLMCLICNTKETISEHLAQHFSVAEMTQCIKKFFHDLQLSLSRQKIPAWLCSDDDRLRFLRPCYSPKAASRSSLLVFLPLHPPTISKKVRRIARLSTWLLIMWLSKCKIDFGPECDGSAEPVAGWVCGTGEGPACISWGEATERAPAYTVAP